MSWESPIEIIVNQIESAWMDETFRVIQKVGINVDRNELIKALQYDRNQYEKGYDDGKKEATESVRHGYWIDDCTCSVCLWTHTNPDGYALVTNYNYCPTCGTKMDGERRTDEISSAL